MEPRKSSQGASVLHAWLLLLVSCSAAPRASAPNDRDRGSLALTFENDLFTGSDGNYTNGLALAWTSGPVADMRPDAGLRRWAETLSFLPLAGDREREVRTTFALGQEIFTPDDLEATVPLPDDQPYAGVLFGDVGLLARTQRTSQVWRLRLGLVGPSAGGESVQREVHETLSADMPSGWDFQLPDEPLLNLDYGVSHELFAGGGESEFSWSVAPAGGLGLGTYFTGASASLRGECGWNLPALAAVPDLRHGVGALSHFEPRADSSGAGRWSVGLSATVGGMLVAHYLPLDGTVFESSPSIDSEPVVGFVSAGVSLRKRRFALAYRMTFFTDTFESQPEATDFGTLTLSWSF